jgi:hypothetical protein
MYYVCSGKFFVCVHGFMPAKVTTNTSQPLLLYFLFQHRLDSRYMLGCCSQVLLFDAKCKPVYDMGSGPYGMAAWNPQVSARALLVMCCNYFEKTTCVMSFLLSRVHATSQSRPPEAPSVVHCVHRVDSWLWEALAI